MCFIYMDKEEPPRKHHYVPISYLNNFTYLENGKNHIWCFNKKGQGIYSTTPKKVCVEKNFHGYGKSAKDFEKFLCDIESNSALTIREVIRKDSILNISKKSRMNMSIFFASLYLRVKEKTEIREQLFKMLKKVIDENNPTQELQSKWNVFEKNYDKKEIHRNSLRKIPKYALIINKMHWLLLKNRTKLPFWTSDNPITVDNIINQNNYGRFGLCSYGVEFYLPLSSTLCMAFLEPKSHSGLSLLEGAELHENNCVEYLNGLQVRDAIQTVFSKDSNFKLAEQIIQDFPEIRDPKRKRMGT